MAKHLIFGDGHLADRSWAKKEIVGDSYYGLEQIGNIAIAERCETVTSAGDLIDQARNFSSPIAALGRLVSKLHHAQIKFQYVLGQHDMADPPWPAQFAGAVHIDKKAVRLGEFWLYGLDFRHADELLVELSCIPEKVSILIAHQAWDECKANMAPAQASVKKDTPAHINMIFTGDYHVMLRKKVKRQDKDPVWVMSPGSTCLQSTDEPLNKYVFIFDDQTGEVETRDLVTRPVIRLENIIDDQALEDSLDLLPGRINVINRDAIASELVSRPLVIVKVGKGVNKAASSIRKICKELDAHCIIGTVKPTIVKADPKDDDDDDKEATPVNVKQFLQSALNVVFGEEDAAARNLCNELVLAEATEEGTRRVLNKFWEERQAQPC
jgi:hypothetical protein